jgi:hypothetical protein
VTTAILVIDNRAQGRNAIALRLNSALEPAPMPGYYRFSDEIAAEIVHLLKQLAEADDYLANPVGSDVKSLVGNDGEINYSCLTYWLKKQGTTEKFDRTVVKRLLEPGERNLYRRGVGRTEYLDNLVNAVNKLCDTSCAKPESGAEIKRKLEEKGLGRVEFDAYWDEDNDTFPSGHVEIADFPSTYTGPKKEDSQDDEVGSAPLPKGPAAGQRPHVPYPSRSQERSQPGPNLGEETSVDATPLPSEAETQIIKTIPMVSSQSPLSPELSPRDFKELRQLIKSVYQSHARLEMFVEEYIERGIALWGREDDLDIAASKLIRWAEAQGRLPELLNALMEDAPNRGDIQMFCQQLLASFLG